MKEKSFGFIGGGRVVRIILKALQNENQLPAKIIISDSNQEILNRIKTEFPSVIITSKNTEPAECDYVFVSLHPPVIASVITEIKDILKEGSYLISLAPKISIKKFKELSGKNIKVIRLIPNAISYINKGYNPIAFDSTLTEENREEMFQLFNLLGTTVEVDEEKLESYAIITAMGPTYLWFQLETIHNLGKSFGLTDEELKNGLLSTITGAVETLYNSGLNFEQVKDLIPVKPLAESENQIREIYSNSLNALYNRLKS